MNSLMKQNSNLPTEQTVDPFQAYGDQVRQTAIVGHLLKFSKGDWVAGEEQAEIPDGTKFIVHMGELLVGWVRWKDSRPTDHVMGRVIDGYKPPRRETLGDLDENEWETDDAGQARDPWQFSNYLLMLGPDLDTGEMTQAYTFVTASRGGINAVGDLCVKYGKMRRQRPNDMPVVELSQGSYQHKDRSLGRIKYPIFNVVGWEPATIFEGMTDPNRPVDPEEAEGDLQDNEQIPFPEPGPAPAPAPAPKATKPAKAPPKTAAPAPAPKAAPQPAEKPAPKGRVQPRF